MFNAYNNFFTCANKRLTLLQEGNTINMEERGSYLMMDNDFDD